MEKFRKKYRLLLIILILVTVFFNVIGRVSLNRESRSTYPDQPLFQFTISSIEWLHFSIGGTIGNLILITFLVWLAGCFWDKELRPSYSGFEIPVITYLIIVTLAFLFSPDPAESWRTGYKQFLIEVAWFFILVSVLRREKYQRAVFAVLLGTLGLTVLAGLALYWRGIYFPQTPGRIWMSFGNPNSSGPVLVLLIPWVIAPLWERPPRWVAGVSSFLALGFVLALLLTFSRAAWIGLFPALGILFIRGRAKFLLPASAIILLGLLVWGLNLGSRTHLEDRVRSISAWRVDKSVQYRLIYWEAAGRMIKERPLLGSGPGYGIFIRKYRDEFKVLDTGEKVTAPHNNYLSIAVSTGLLGLAAFLFLLFTAFRSATEDFRSSSGWFGKSLVVGMTAGLTGFLVGCLFDDPLLNENISFIFWLLLGVLGARQADRRTRRDISRL